MPLLHSTSRVSSPEGGGNVPLTTWTFWILFRDWGTLLNCQNAVKSLLFGKVSMTIAIVSPLPFVLAEFAP